MTTQAQNIQKLNRPLQVNFVISKDLKSKIFGDIFKRYSAYDPSQLNVTVSEKPVENADIYHYHRPHLETELVSPAVVTVHHDPRDVDPWLDNKKFWKTYAQTARIVCLNTLQVEDLAKVNFHNTVVIPHGYDQIIFTKEKKKFPPKGKINLGIISKRYDRRFKGDAYIYEIIDRISPDLVKFTLVGAGRAIDAENFRQKGFEVDIFEFLPYRLFGKLYNSIDALLMVSTYEGGPANLPEALSSSTPVICTNVGMVPDMVVDNKSGLILTGDINVDFPRIDGFCKNTDGITNKLFKGAHESSSIITWEEVIQKHIEMYTEIVIENQ